MVCQGRSSQVRPIQVRTGQVKIHDSDRCRSSQVRTVQSLGGSGSAVIKRNFSDSGIGQGNYSPQPQNKRINAKIEFKAYKGNNGNSYSNDDEITIIGFVMIILNLNPLRRQGGSDLFLGVKNMLGPY